MVWCRDAYVIISSRSITGPSVDVLAKLVAEAGPLPSPKAGSGAIMGRPNQEHVSELRGTALNRRQPRSNELGNRVLPCKLRSQISAPGESPQPAVFHCMTGLGHSQTGRFSTLTAARGTARSLRAPRSPSLPATVLPSRGAGHALRLETFECRWRDVESLHRDRVGCPAGPATYPMDGDEMTTDPPNRSRDRIRARPATVSTRERFGNTEELTKSTALE